MSTFRNPVGPQPAHVYWRRRLVVGLGLLAVIIIIVLIIVRPGSGEPAPAPSGSSTPGPTGSSTSEPVSTNPAEAAACDPAKITVEGVVSDNSFEAGELPALSLVVKSTATTPCTIQAGSDVMEFRITSGSELIWTSKHCQTDPEPRLQLLNPGVPVSTPPITWDRTRSDPATCDASRDQVIAEGASYHLTVVLGDHESSNSTQFLLY